MSVEDEIIAFAADLQGRGEYRRGKALRRRKSDGGCRRNKKARRSSRARSGGLWFLIARGRRQRAKPFGDRWTDTVGQTRGLQAPPTGSRNPGTSSPLLASRSFRQPSFPGRLGPPGRRVSRAASRWLRWSSKSDLVSGVPVLPFHTYCKHFKGRFQLQRVLFWRWWELVFCCFLASERERQNADGYAGTSFAL